MKNYIVVLLIIISSCAEDESSAPLPAPLLGCTNQNAVNYDAGATQDNGSCVLAPQHIPGIQLGDYYNNEGTVFYLDGNGGGMIFKDCWSATGLHVSGAIKWSLYSETSIPTGTAIGAGYNNTELIFNQGFDSGPEQYWVDAGFGHFPSGGWHIPSIDEVRELYMYGSAPYYDSINYPGAIRGWGYGFGPIVFGNESHINYGNGTPGSYPYLHNPIIVSSSEASSTTFYWMKFEENWNGLYSEAPKYNGIHLGSNSARIIGVKSF